MPSTRLPTPPPSSEPTDNHRPRREAATGAPPTRPDGLRMSLLPGPLSGGKTMQRLQSVVSQGGARRSMLRLRRSPHRERPHRLRPPLQGGDSHLILSNAFREISTGLYKTSRDALFELLDAATVAGLVPSLAYLSLLPVHRRRWGSLYDALAAGTLEAPALRELIARYPLDDGQPIYALDTSVWPRDDAETSPGRGHYFSSARQSAGKPIVTGWSYSWLAQLSFTHDSWTAPLDVQRVPAGGNVHAVAAAQISELMEHVPAADRPVPLFVFDAGYDPEALARELAELDGQHVAVLVRLRSDRCFYADPPSLVGSKVGRPRRHGQKFTCAEECTWWAPTSEHREQHAQYGLVRVRAWAGVHAKTQNHPQRGSYRTKPTVRGTLVLVEVERLPRQTRIPRRLWLWWRGPDEPDLAAVWRAYVHRFDLE